MFCECMLYLVKISGPAVRLIVAVSVRVYHPAVLLIVGYAYISVSLKLNILPDTALHFADVDGIQAVISILTLRM